MNGFWEAVRAELRERGGEIESEDVLDALQASPSPRCR